MASLYSPEQRSNISILDIGAGTGLVASELRKVGFNIIDGLDPSQGMLEKAKQKDVYRNLYCMEISDESLNITKDSYDVITVVGSHGPNHIKSEAIKEMIRLVKQGTFVVFVSFESLSIC
ncbi:hypothetical protein FSP39_000742 [Pinctada imbricata]|uniref:Methyltransferase domain-containing protein n=1 Tax=Pinctada imbricata TaxID=66713 RepID=A0AA89C612_PINIB|nr:hypothetical protein FSP39_000742 [Pinctada imbricata]